MLGGGGGGCWTAHFSIIIIIEVKFLEKLDPENRKYFLAMAKEKGIDFKVLFDKYKDMDAERINKLLDTEITDSLPPFYATA